MERLAVRHSHPAWVVRALRQALLADGRPADELEALLEADNAAPAVTLCARPGLADVEQVLAAVPGAARGRWAATAVRMAGGDPATVPGLADGRVAVQDEGSQLVALALAAVPLAGADGPWLDLCAGPGGKAALLGALAADARRGAGGQRAPAAPGRAGATGRPGPRRARSRSGSATVGRSVRLEPGRYDRVLLDAPCTGLGALRRRPESRWRRRPGDVPVLGELQRELLDAALDATAPGGVVAYVTCSPHVAETRLVVADVISGRDDVELLDATEALRAVAPELELGPGPHAQLWPHLHGTDAMHLTLLRRLPTAGCGRVVTGPRVPVRHTGAMDVLISPSILSADFANLAAELARISRRRHGARRRHGRALRAQPDPRPAGGRAARRRCPRCRSTCT